MQGEREKNKATRNGGLVFPVGPESHVVARDGDVHTFLYFILMSQEQTCCSLQLMVLEFHKAARETERWTSLFCF